jgi:hypothetical protein
VSRTLLCCAVLAGWVFPCRAEPLVTPTETVIRLTVQPMAAPRPALRYLLLPELKEMTPGNPIPNYLECFFDQDFSAERETLRKSALRQADRAARMDKPDWQILPKLKTDGIGLLLPDVQKMRALASELQVRFQEEIGQRRFADALRTAKTMFALSRHMGEHPTLIGDLVAMAIANVAIVPLEEMLEQPGCPNLYWALTNLPSPLISLDKGMEGERALMRGEFKELDDSTPMTQNQLDKLIVHIDRLLDFEVPAKKPKGGTRAWLNARKGDKELLAAARRRLVEAGLPEERLLRFPAEQVLLLDEWREFEVQRDEVMKLINLPTWQFESFSPPLPQKKGTRALGKSLFYGLVPALHKVRGAQGRLEQRIALLRHVEALRLSAAAHDGKLPEKLADFSVPLPPDPFTGKPFLYKVEGATAHFRGTPPQREKNNPAYNVHFEVTVQK